ncbi:MAG: GDP-mannose 4,6-dehydratase [Coprothermobacterota bacterium]|nr:GDP-mannose 4,6-dehydratase [Coprothermobacterota bacterium]
MTRGRRTGAIGGNWRDKGNGLHQGDIGLCIIAGMGLFLVTGGAGFIGSHLAEHLLNAGHRVRILDNLSTGRRQNLAHLSKKVEFLLGDIRRQTDLGTATKGSDGVFHLAAIASVQRSIRYPLLTHEVNATGTLRLLQAARRTGVARVVVISTAAVYGDAPSLPVQEDSLPAPLSPYGTSKAAAEEYALMFSRLGWLQTVVIRPFNIYGPRQDPGSPYSGVISRFVESAVRGRDPALYGDGSQTRDFLFVADLCRALAQAMEEEKAEGQILNVAGGRETSIATLGEVLFRLQGRAFAPSIHPARSGDIRHSLASIAKAETILGWRPQTPLEQGLRQTLHWMRREEEGE